MRNKALFEKGTTTAKWSPTVHTVVEKAVHSYILENNETYKYYELLPVVPVEHCTSQPRERRRKNQQNNNWRRKILAEDVWTAKDLQVQILLMQSVQGFRLIDFIF